MVSWALARRWVGESSAIGGGTGESAACNESGLNPENDDDFSYLLIISCLSYIRPVAMYTSTRHVSMQLRYSLNNVNKKRKSNTVRLVKRLIDSRFIAIVIIKLINAFNFLGHVVWYL